MLRSPSVRSWSAIVFLALLATTVWFGVDGSAQGEADATPPAATADASSATQCVPEETTFPTTVNNHVFEFEGGNFQIWSVAIDLEAGTSIEGCFLGHTLIVVTAGTLTLSFPDPAQCGEVTIEFANSSTPPPTPGGCGDLAADASVEVSAGDEIYAEYSRLHLAATGTASVRIASFREHEAGCGGVACP